MNPFAAKKLWDKFLETSAADPDDARRRKLLNIVLTGVGTAVIFGNAYVGWAVWSSPVPLAPQGAAEVWSIAFVSGLILLGAAVFYFINRFLSGLLAGFLFILFLSGALLLSDSPAELSGGRSAYLFIIPIVMAGALLPSWMVFVFAFLSGAEIIAVAYFSGGEASYLTVIAFFFVAFLSWLSSRSLEQALRETRRINENLDRLVKEKTQALSETLARELILAGRNQAILDSIADGVVVFDEQQTVILANPALSGMTGIPLERLKGMSAADFAAAKELPPAQQSLLPELVSQPEKFKEGTRLKWGGKILSVRAARAQTAETRENFGTVAVFRDVTREAEVEKMKETFVAVVSHELRTPLNAIMGYAEMLRDEFYGTLAEKQKSALERVMVNVSRMFVMVGDLLDEAQLKAGKLSIKDESVRVDELIKSLRAELEKSAAEKGIGFSIELDPAMPPVLVGDHQRLQQIIVNLAGNAIKFTDKGGARVELLRAGADTWQIRVSDTGAGIPPRELPRIFEPFRQIEEPARRLHGGFGLGLAIVKQLTELMNGTIVVESEPGKGSVFTVTLPLRLESKQSSK